MAEKLSAVAAMQMHVRQIANRPASDGKIVVIDLTGIHCRAASSCCSRKKMSRYSEIGSRFNIVVKIDFFINCIEDSNPHFLSVEKIGLAGDGGPDAPENYA